MYNDFEISGVHAREILDSRGNPTLEVEVRLEGGAAVSYTHLVGMIIGMVVSSAVFKVVPLVSIIGAFFTGGVAGIFGNANGGRRCV